MRRIVLFSTPTETNIARVQSALFPSWLTSRNLAYMPSDGANSPKKYSDFWHDIALSNKASFREVNNSVPPEMATEESNKILDSTVLLISGGNTFRLLHNLRQSGLDKAVTEFSRKDDSVLAGFSAGAIVLSPKINVCTIENFDTNYDNLDDLSGLNIINFEIFPHYSDNFTQQVNKYEKENRTSLLKISDEDCLVYEDGHQLA